MRNQLTWLLSLLAVAGISITGLAAGEGGAEPAAPPPQALERARQAGQALAGELMGRLAAELQAGGPARAVRVCSEVAQEIAAAHSTGGLTVRRVSLKVRNPADRPDDYERRQLERLEALHRQGELPGEVVEVVRQEGRPVLRYLKPIRIMPLCLQCHGDPADFDPAVRRLLEERYPEDEAVGYQAGDLRGAVSVQVELSQADPGQADPGEADPGGE